MIQNLHTHTTFCDGANTPEEMVRSALALGMDSLGFSFSVVLRFAGDNHLGALLPYLFENFVQPLLEQVGGVGPFVPAYRAELLRLCPEYAGQMDILLGLERDYFWAPDGDGWDYVYGR